MRHVVTALLAIAAFVLGVVIAGYLGDQGKGVDLLPFVVGGALAVAVVLLRELTNKRSRA